MPTFDKYFDKAALDGRRLRQAEPGQGEAACWPSAGYSPSNPLKLSVITITGYTDWDASLAVIKQQLAPIGIELTVSDLPQQTYDDKLFTGDFDLAYYGQAGGPTPYYELRQLLYSKNSAPIGKPANSNYERYTNPEVDALFDQYPTADDAGQVDIIKQIDAAMLRDVPIIPTTESVDWFQYNTADIEGWPTEDDPYAQPARVQRPRRRAGAAAPVLQVGPEVQATSGQGEHEELVAVRYLLRRLGFFVLTLWAALTLNFFIPRFMPGSPAAGAAGPHAQQALARRRWSRC